jgi:4-amino-4-deoxy-L-arabinose transferase-like glycosyltransferase
MKRRPGLHTIGLLLCVGYVSLLMHTAGAIGLSRDEGIYVDAAQRYAGWVELLLHDRARALEQTSIDATFQVNHEHPPLMKLLFGLGYLAHLKSGVFATDSTAFRFAGMLSAGLLVWLIYVFGARVYGRNAGLFAAFAYALLPRPFYHAHLDAFDVPIALASTAVVYAYYRSLRDPRFAVVTGIAFGLALLTKHNSWILPGVFAIHFAWCAWLEWRSRKRTGVRNMSLVPYWLLAMGTLGPLIFIGGWPWLWHDTLVRLNSYGAFHLHHEYYNIEYFGVNYFWPPFPSSYAWIMTLFTVPLTTLVLGIGGLVYEVQAAAFRPKQDPTQTTVLMLGALLAPLLIISLPSTPIFGGTKHWFSAYPMLALFAGRAFQALTAALPVRGGRTRVALAWGAGAWLLAPAALETAHSHPFALSHYTVAAGGVPGAAEKGMNRQFWGFTTRSLVPYLRSTLPHGGTLYICDTIYWAFEMLIRDGLLPATFRPTGEIARADYALVHHEKHFAEVDHQIWTTYGSVQPVHVLTYDGVPIISVYKNPRGNRAR